jgi:LPS sulfotransferase NodH
MLAPIGISVYTRLAHFKGAIEALQKNTLAAGSNLVVYSDAASRDEDIELVNNVRIYAKSIQGFRSVTVIERSLNYGGVKNAHRAALQLVQIFKQAIFIEDDIETAPGFLAYMNGALNFYKDNPAVTSISGYSPPLNISEYVVNDFYVMNRFCGWGCGLYERTAECLQKKISQTEFDDLDDKKVLCEFGDDVRAMVQKEVNGELDAADVRCMFRQAVHNTATIYPRFSLVQNLGHDGSGYHCGVSNRFQHATLWDKTDGFVFNNNLNVDEQIKKEQQDFRSFKGDYEVLRMLNNQKQSKEVALNYINSLFKKDLSKLGASEQRPYSKSCKVAILSTPRVGSTFLSYMLYPYFGESIRREWLHNRYLEAFHNLKQNNSAKEYLDFLKNKAFTDCDVLGFHFHVNQVIAWKQNFDIDVFDYYDFDHVVYMERKNVFAQSYSLAVATESGLWGSEIINALNIAKDFKVQVSKNAFDKAYKGIIQEQEYCEKHLKSHITHTIGYEDLVQNPQEEIANLFERKLKITPKLGGLDIASPEKCVSIVCEENKEELQSYFNAKYANT